MFARVERVEIGDTIDADTTASPSMTKCLTLFLSALSTIQG
jgi:hypothetical protein